MYRHIMFSILCCLLVARLINAAQLRSPCPNVFTYEGEPENDRWYGIMTFSSNIELVGLIYKIQLDRPGQLLVSWDGEVRSEDNIIFSVFDPKHFQRPGEVVKARIMVKFNPSSNPPNVVKIIINGNIMCSGDGNNPLTLGIPTESPSNNRPDPTFVEEDIVSEYNNRPSSNQNTNLGIDKGSRPTYYEPNYGGGSGTNFNTISGSSPNYNGGESNYASNSNSAGYNNANTNYQTPVNPKPSYPSNVNNQNYPSNPTYSNSQNNYIPAENIVYPTNIQSSSGFSNAQPQWPSSENQQSNYGTNRNNSNSGSSSSNQGTNNGPLVTTLTLPNNTQNKNNVDTIIQIIKNQLEQQQVTSNTNNTVIVALVSPVNSNHGGQQAVPNSSQNQNRESIIETTTHRTTTSTPSSVVSKLRSTTTTPPSTKSPTIRNKD